MYKDRFWRDGSLVSREFVCCPIYVWKFQEGCYYEGFKITVLKSLSLIVPRPFYSYSFNHANTYGKSKNCESLHYHFLLFFVILLRFSYSLTLPLKITSVYVSPSERAIFSCTHTKLQACRYILLCCSVHCKTVSLLLSFRVQLRVTLIKTSSEIHTDL